MIEETVLHLLAQHAAQQPEKLLYGYLASDLSIAESITYASLYQRSTLLAKQLLQDHAPGERCLLLFPTGSEFIHAFWGCLQAGIIPLPVYPPGKTQRSERLESIVTDAGASFALTSAQFADKCMTWLNSNPAREADIRVMVYDENPDGNPHATLGALPEITPESLAFIQYTSGSTGEPKGVQIHHRQLLDNLGQIAAAFGITSQSIGCGWLPLYHDMGLVGNLLAPAFAGCSIYLMSPPDFLRHPLSWLQAISRYRATICGAPNFAYQLLAERAAKTPPENLDLYCWQVAFCGAEPVNATTLANFSHMFSDSGFSADAFLPCYGMAEATLLVSGVKPHTAVNTLRVSRTALQQHQVVVRNEDDPETVSLVSCGKPGPGTLVYIIDPDSTTLLPDNQIGEICVSSPSVTNGYWNKPALNAQTFLSPDKANPAERLLRTGDLGFLHQGELFVSGRRKELIIIRGKNYVPQDIETLAAASHEAINPLRIAAFSVVSPQGESLALVAELQRSHLRSCSPDDVWQAVCRQIGEHLGLAVSGGALLRPGQLPITSSGKIQRLKCREHYQTGQLECIHQWPAPQHASTRQPQPEKVATLIQWLHRFASKRLNSHLMDERRSLSPHVVLELGNQGILGMNVPTEYGGLGLSDEETLQVIQQLGSIDLTVAALVGVHLALGVGPLLAFGTPAQKQRWLPALATGRQLAAFAITEPGAGSNPRAMTATASWDASTQTWRLTGEKCWIGNAGWSAVMTVFAHATNPASGQKGISAFVLETDQEGVQIGPEALTMGMRGMVQNSVGFEQVSLDTQQILQQPGDGFRIAQSAMNTGRLGIASMCVGGIRRAVLWMQQYASQREIQTGKLLANPITRQRLAWMIHAANAIEDYCRYLAVQRDNGVEIQEEAYAVAKVCGPEMLFQATDHLMQALGGRGYMEPSLIPQLVRDARLLRIFEGPTETLQMHLGQVLLHHEDRLRSLAVQLNDTKDQLKSLLDWKRQSLAMLPDTVDRLAWCHAAGQIVSLTLLSLTATTAATRHWLADEIRLSIQRAEKLFAATAADNDCLETAIADINKAIGGGQQCLPGEDRHYDPFTPWQQTESSTTKGHSLGTTLPSTTTAPTLATVSENQSRIEQWLLDWLQRRLPAANLAAGANSLIATLGLDSILAVECAVDLEEWLGLPVSGDMFWEAKSIRELAMLLDKPSPTLGPASHHKEASTPQDNSKAAAPIRLPSVSKTDLPTLSLFFFGQGEASPQQYQLLMDCAVYADEKGFEAIWTPERHFHAFGAAFPDPAVLSAALARQTRQIHLRAGSVVLPLHHPARIAEQWALVDQLSHGRAGVAITAGWSPNDFLLAPERFDERFAALPELINQLRQLWRGEALSVTNAHGEVVTVNSYPLPHQPTLPVWLTCNRRPEGFIEAGKLGLNVLTALLNQTPEELKENIRQYRQTLAASGYPPGHGKVTLMLHAYCGTEQTAILEAVRKPLGDYLKSSADLWKQATDRFDQLDDHARQKMLDFAVERYIQQSSLIGTPDFCRQRLAEWRMAGVDEVACLVDFGIEEKSLRQSLGLLATLLPANQRLYPLKTPANPESTLVMIPPAGAHPQVFQALADQLPATVAVIGIDTTGYDDLAPLLADIQPALIRHLRTPFAIYGHSLGALIGYELALAMQAQGYTPTWLGIGAQHAPQLPYPHPALPVNVDVSHPLLAAILEEYPASFRDKHWPVLREKLLPGIKMQSTSYQHQTGTRLNCRIRVWHGSDDPLLREEQLLPWLALGNSTSGLHSITGGHLFYRQTDQLAEAIRQLMNETTTPS